MLPQCELLPEARIDHAAVLDRPIFQARAEDELVSQQLEALGVAIDRAVIRVRVSKAMTLDTLDGTLVAHGREVRSQLVDGQVPVVHVPQRAGERLDVLQQVHLEGAQGLG